MYRYIQLESTKKGVIMVNSVSVQTVLVLEKLLNYAFHYAQIMPLIMLHYTGIMPRIVLYYAAVQSNGMMNSVQTVLDGLCSVNC